ncbi:hypothetical protein [Rhodococcus triatomae]|nr:hypothetical protein [Rhodococcus triatomae]
MTAEHHYMRTRGALMSEQKPLHLTDGAIEELVGICEDIITNLEEAMGKSAALDWVSGFGGFDSANQLEVGYKRKGSGGEDSVYDRLIDFKEAVEAMRDAFRAGGDAYADQESAVMQKIAGIAGGISS